MYHERPAVKVGCFVMQKSEKIFEEIFKKLLTFLRGYVIIRMVRKDC